MESIQAAVKEHIQGKLREIGSTLDEERRELSVRVCLFRCTTRFAMLPRFVVSGSLGNYRRLSLLYRQSTVDFEPDK